MRVALFVTCFNDTLFPHTGRAVVELLERLGCEVDFPEEQTCCGQMHGNSGYQDQGEALARRFERVFAGAEAVVSPSASCVGLPARARGDRRSACTSSPSSSSTCSASTTSAPRSRTA